MKITVLGSGSRGNSTVISNENTLVVIDQGFSCRNFIKRLTESGFKPEKVGAFLITHEHSDHINGIEVFQKKYPVPVYMNRKTYARLRHGLKKILDGRVRFFETGDSFQFDSFSIDTFAISHDAADPVGYSVSEKEKKFCYVTDTGVITDAIVENMKNADVLMIESNHDLHMLRNGDYPYILKRRIEGSDGHLSNVDTGEILREICGDKTHTVVLAHLSQENNRKKIARECAEEYLSRSKNGIPRILVASQSEPLETFEV